MKRALCLSLAVVIAVVLLPLTALTEESGEAVTLLDITLRELPGEEKGTTELASGTEVRILLSVFVNGEPWALVSPSDSGSLGYVKMQELEKIQTASEVSAPKLQTKPSVAVLSELFPASEVRLSQPNDESFRIYSYTGPGKSFVSSGGYKPYKQKKITAYYEENGFILADIVYQTVEERFVYLPKYGFDYIKDIPSVSDLESYDGMTTARIIPSWGPDQRFHAVDSLAVDKGAHIKVFFQENGFVFAEYDCEKGTVRMWLPAEHIEIPDATVTLSSIPISPAGQSSFK